MDKCPGQDGRSLSADMLTCRDCGAEVELFSDEPRLKCHQCGELVEREVVPNCASWCAQARECVGEDRWRQSKRAS